MHNFSNLIKIISVIFISVLLSAKLYAKQISIEQSHYGNLSSGAPISSYQLTVNKMTLNVINYGAIITHLLDGRNSLTVDNLVLGYDNLADYEKRNRFFGAVVGRYANRIRNAAININGKQYQLEANKQQHQIHGGVKGFDKQVWQAHTYQDNHSASIRLTYDSPDGEAGYPGHLKVSVTYTLTDQYELITEYFATTDKATVVNLTQHSYFNLNPASKDVLQHQLFVDSDTYLPLDSEGFPLAHGQSVVNTPFDFRHPQVIGKNMIQANPQIKIGKGFDHYFVLNKSAHVLTKAAELTAPQVGRKMTVYTTEPGLQVYTANYLNESVIGQGNKKYKIHQGICLETGQYPNAPAEKAFPLRLTTPDKPYQSKTVFQF